MGGRTDQDDFPFGLQACREDAWAGALAANQTGLNLGSGTHQLHGLTGKHLPVSLSDWADHIWLAGLL